MKLRFLVITLPVVCFWLVASSDGTGSAQNVLPHEQKHQARVVDRKDPKYPKYPKYHSSTVATPPVCKPPYIKIPEAPPKLRHRLPAQPDTTPPTPPESLQVFRESIHSVFASWKESSDPESGIDYYAFACGSAPGEGDVTWWQSVGLSLTSYAKSMNELGLSEGDTVYISVRANNTIGMSSDIVSSGPIVFQYEPLGEDTNTMSISYAGGWTQAELADLQWFLGRMLPIIKEIYGPPSHAYAVTLVKDSYYSSSAIFFPSSNEIHMNALYPQLLTHEVIHAFRDNVIISSNDYWGYDPTLSGFEEGFAQGISYACMNRYVELYPTDPIVPISSLYGSTYDWDYDYRNTDILTTTDFWSDYSGTGIYWLRYEMAAAAIIKILQDYPNFAHEFNSEYYSRLNADHALTTSRALIRQVIAQVAPFIEGHEGNQWVDQQHIFDCFIRPGRKIWVRTQHYPSWMEYLIFQRIFYYETFSNSSEWAYWDDNSSSWVYYNLNGSMGHAVLSDWNGSIIEEKALLIEPVDNPPVYYGFGNDEVNLSTDDDTDPWPNEDTANYMLGLHDFGLYRLELSFGSDTTEVVRVMGDTLRNTSGVFGGVLNTTGGVIYLDHEDFPDEPPLPVVNGVFHGERSWTTIPNPNTGYDDSKPGRVFVTFIDNNGNEYCAQRNIDLGSWSGNQLFLFDTQTMTPVVIGGDHVRVNAPNGGEVVMPDSVITIIWQILISDTLVNWDLWYSTTGAGGPWIEIAADLPPGSTQVGSTHTYDWTVPDTPSSKVRVRVCMDNTGTDYEDMSDGNLTIDSPTSVNLKYFTAERQGRRALLRWEVAYAADHRGFNVYREELGGGMKRINPGLLAGSRRYEFEDASAPAAQTRYWLQEIETGSKANWYGPAVLAPDQTIGLVPSLTTNYPNPFSSGTKIHYSLPETGRVLLTVYDTRGRLIKTLVNDVRAAGAYATQWSGRDNKGNQVASGVYFLRFKFGKHLQSRKLVILK